MALAFTAERGPPLRPIALGTGGVAKLHTFRSIDILVVGKEATTSLEFLSVDVDRQGLLGIGVVHPMMLKRGNQATHRALTHGHSALGLKAQALVVQRLAAVAGDLKATLDTPFHTPGAAVVVYRSALTGTPDHGHDAEPVGAIAVNQMAGIAAVPTLAQVSGDLKRQLGVVAQKIADSVADFLRVVLAMHHATKILNQCLQTTHRGKIP